jgi:hypothetical protein
MGDRRADNADQLLGLVGKYVQFSQVPDYSLDVPGICPFHKGGNEEVPSFFFYVGPTRGKSETGDSFCFTCGRGWHLASLLRNLKVGYHTIESLRKSIESGENSRQKSKKLNVVDLSLPVLPEMILGAYDFVPLDMVRAGFDEDTLDQFEIGFDRKAQRVTFPIRDHRGALVGVSGRTVIDEIPRYKIYKSEFSEIIRGYSLDKTKVLWGLDKFYIEAQRVGLSGPVVVCEGFKAALKVVQSGYPYVVAMFGTYLSDEQKVLLGRVANEVVLFLDNNTAGIKASVKAYFRLRHSLGVSFARYPRRNEQPDDLSVLEIGDAISNSINYTEWKRNT